MGKLSGKIAVITGAGAGIGRAIALLYLKEGANVVAADVKEDRLQSLKNDAGSDRLAIVKTDMGSESEIEAMIQTAVKQFGSLDILVNNAGIMDNFEPVADVSNDLLEKILKVNVEGPFKAMRSAVKIFLGKGSGVIVNISSIGGLQGARAGAAYTMSKHALIGLTKNTGYMYSKSGIRCNAIAPGGVNTSIGETIDYSKVTPLIQDRIMSAIVTNPRMGEPNEIATAAVFLASDDASYVNAAVLTIDGGWTGF